MDIDGSLGETSALKRKLESKTEALLILTEELNRCRIERDQYKFWAEQDRNSVKKLAVCEELGLYSDCYGCNNQLKAIKAKNKAFLLEIEDLKQKLKDAQGDIKVLRQEKQNERLREGCTTGNWHQREALIQQVEEATSRAKQLQCDLQGVLDEKEELVTERDAYKTKVHRLNHELSVVMKSASTVDIDALVMENKYLQDRIEQLSAEKELIQQTLCKYKGMLDKKKTKGSVRLGTTDSTGGMVVTHKQVQELLENGNAWQMPNTEATLADLRSLSLALLEAVQDKMLALTHQKRANKILASRITELEAKLTKDGTWTIFPSRVLLEGYCSSSVDKDTQRILLDEISGSDDEKRVETASEPIIFTPVAIKEIEEPTERTEGCDEGVLPPDLQDLVMKAIQELKQDSHSID